MTLVIVVAAATSPSPPTFDVDQVPGGIDRPARDCVLHHLGAVRPLARSAEDVVALASLERYASMMGGRRSIVSVAFTGHLFFAVLLGCAPSAPPPPAAVECNDPTTGAPVTNSVTTSGIEPRIGADLPLTSLLSFYPRVGVVAGAASYDEVSVNAENKYSTASAALHVFAPVLIHAASHLFAGFGPSLYWEWSDTVTYPNGTTQNRQTSIGADLVVGGSL
jgi:hypothetical protein